MIINKRALSNPGSYRKASFELLKRSRGPRAVTRCKENIVDLSGLEGKEEIEKLYSKLYSAVGPKREKEEFTILLSKNPPSTQALPINGNLPTVEEILEAKKIYV
jgi:hypothetical protein